MYRSSRAGSTRLIYSLFRDWPFLSCAPLVLDVAHPHRAPLWTLLDQHSSTSVHLRTAFVSVQVMAAPLEPPEPAGAAALRLPVAVQQNIGGSCTPTLQQMLVLAEREASAYKKELPLGRESVRLGDHLREDVEYLQALLQVSISSFHVRCDNAQVGRWQAPRQQAAARTGASSLEECLKSKQHELARHREELASYEEAIQAGEQLWKDVQYVGQLAHFALCNFRKGKREIERVRLENRHPALHRGCRVSSGHHTPRPHHPLAPVRSMDHPPPLRPVEHIIAKVHGSSVAINAMRANLESTKTEPASSLKEMVSCKKQEANGYREELIFCKDTIRSGAHLFEEMQRVEERIQRAVHSFHLTIRGVERAGRRN